MWLLGARHPPQTPYFVFMNSFHDDNDYEVDLAIAPILQMSKRRHKVVKKSDGVALGFKPSPLVPQVVLDRTSMLSGRSLSAQSGSQPSRVR